MRIVLYAEGPNETGVVESPPLYAPRARIAEDALGPAHLLTRRAVALVASRDERSIQFQAPLLPRGKPARGSQLLKARTVEQLLTWVHPDLPPDIAILLVDADGSSTRRGELEAVLARRRIVVPPSVVAVAVQEFEAWMLADLGPVQRLVDRNIDPLSDLEKWKPGEAKHALAGFLGGSRQEQHRAHLDICGTCDLNTVARNSSSFRRYLDELRRACSSIP